MKGSGMHTPGTLLELSSPRQALVRLCQTLNYGSVESLMVRGSEPVFEPLPLIVIDLKLDSEELRRQELGLADFELCDEIRRLMNRINELKDGTIRRLEVRAGIPRRVVLEYKSLVVTGWNEQFCS
jgi:hypothetical protein